MRNQIPDPAGFSVLIASLPVPIIRIKLRRIYTKTLADAYYRIKRSAADITGQKRHQRAVWDIRFECKFSET